MGRFPAGHQNHTNLLSDLVYPSNFNSTNGKFIVKLYFNGCRRKVIIDDNVPVGPTGKMLTMTSTVNKKKLFLPVLIEKAYMKMMGGYDFPGSNSGVDMHTLFGWIPERVDFTAGATITCGTDAKKFDAKNWYDKMLCPRFQA